MYSLSIKTFLTLNLCALSVDLYKINNSSNFMFEEAELSQGCVNRLLPHESICDSQIDKMIFLIT